MTTRVINEQGRRRDLSRFGYRTDDPDLSAVWRRLRVDFPVRWAEVELSSLAEPLRQAAERYCVHRATLDDLLDQCDRIHMEIFDKGPERERVERYAAARDAYEDAVEVFGELRVTLQKALTDREAA